MDREAALMVSTTRTRIRSQRLPSSITRIALLTVIAGAVMTAPASAADPTLVKRLGSTSTDEVVAAIRPLGDKGDVSALPALEALYDDALRVADDGAVFLYDSRKRSLRDPITGAPVARSSSGMRAGEMNNEIRRVILPVMARLKLSAPARATRLAAAEELAKRGGDDTIPLLDRK